MSFVGDLMRLGAPFLAFAVAYALTSLVNTWGMFRIAAIIVALGIAWNFITLFQFVPPAISNLVLVAALAPAWIGAASGLLVRAYQMQQPGITMRTRIITSAIGFVVFGAIAYVLG